VIFGSLSDDPGSGLAGVLAHVGILEMKVEYASRECFVWKRIALDSDSKTVTG
jgi:hypothetical protein